MIFAVIQIVLSVVAGAGLFFMWRRVAASSVAVARLVTAGVLIRAIGGQIAFWISYLHLPIARSLQLGDGFWFFGLDATAYFAASAAVARSGPVAILLVNRAVSSSFYVQTLAATILLFGAIAATALILNIAAYLGCCFIALSFGDPKKHRAVVFAIAVLSLAPSTVMWSLQAMKDTWFIFLVAAFFGAARLWQHAWSRKNATGSRIWWTLVMFGTLYGISGIRWYFGLITAVACLPFLVLSILRTFPRSIGVAAALGLVPVLFAAVILGSGPSISPILRPFRQVGSTSLITELPKTLFAYLRISRYGFDNSGGTTLIGAGHAISAVDSTFGGHERRVEAIRPAETLGYRLRTASKQKPELPVIEVTQIPAPASPAVVGSGPAPPVIVESKPAPAQPLAVESKPAPAQPVAVESKPAPAQPVAAESKPVLAPPVVNSKPAPAPPVVVNLKPAAAQKPALAPTAVEKPKPAPARPVVVTQKPAPTQTPTAIANRKPAQPVPTTAKPAVVAHEPVTTSIAEAAPEPSRVIATRPAAPPVRNRPDGIEVAEGGTPGTGTAGIVAMPDSHAARFLAGAVAMIVPRTIAQRLGILDLRGGRGLWLFADFDTIVFDVVCLFCIVAIIGSIRRRERLEPAFWLILTVTVIVGGLLAYTVSNFGTLFRHREMVLIGLLLLPLAALPTTEVAANSVPEELHGLAGDVANAVN
jgi:hypothetical protein